MRCRTRPKADFSDAPDSAFSSMLLSIFMSSGTTTNAQMLLETATGAGRTSNRSSKCVVDHGGGMARSREMLPEDSDDSAIALRNAREKYGAHSKNLIR